MKPWLRFLLVVTAFGAVLVIVHLSRAAQERQQAGAGEVRVVSVVLRFVVQPNGAVSAAHGTAHIQFVTQSDAKDLASVQFDMLEKPGERVVASGFSREYRALALGIYAAALQEWKDVTSTPPALDEERKATRAK